jgi:hypothetical protein
MRSWVNAVPARSIQRWGLDAQHVPPQTFGIGQTTVLFSGLQASPNSVPNGAGPFEVYTNSLPYAAGPAHPVDYQDFDLSGANPPYGAGGSSGGGWRIPSLALGTFPMEVEFVAPFVLTDYDVKLLVRAHVETYNGDAGDLINDDTVDWGCSINESLNAFVAAKCALIGIGFEDGLGDRYVLERTVRWNNMLGVLRGTISTSTYIRQTDIDVGNGEIAKVFAVAASQQWADSDLAPSPPAHHSLEIRHYNLNVRPFRVT